LANTTSNFADTQYNSLNGKLSTKAKALLEVEIKKYEKTDTVKQDEMINKMIATDYEDYDQAIDILKELITIKDAQNKVPDTVTKLKGFKNDTKKKGWAVLNKYKVGTKDFADDCLEKYEAKKDGKDKKKPVENASIKILGGDYAGRSVADIEADIIASIKDDEMKPADKQIYAKKVSPRLKLAEDLKKKTSNEEKELAKLIRVDGITYDGIICGDAGVEDKFNKVKEAHNKLKKYIAGKDAEGAIFNALIPDDKKIVKDAEKDMSAMIQKMDELRQEDKSKGTPFSPLVGFLVVAVVAGLVGLIIYFLQGRKDSEETEE